MSQSHLDPALHAILVNIGTPSCTEPILPRLVELANHALVLANQPTCYGVSSSVENLQATILYSSEGSEVEQFPVEFLVKVELRQGASSETPGSQQVVIDFQKVTVECADQPNLPINVDEIENAKEEVRAFLQNSLETLRAIQQPDLNNVFSAWRDFLKRLTYNGLLPIQMYIDLDSPRVSIWCPLCGRLTVLCISCDAFMCLNTDCPASRLVPFRSCHAHDRVAACLPCLQNSQHVPLLGQCPKCNIWFCREELVWCPGRTKEDFRWPFDVTDPGPPNSAREHPAKPLACFNCSEDRGSFVNECIQDGCWSTRGEAGYSIRVCESCSPWGGIVCMCEWYWICDGCKWRAGVDWKECPRCERVFCGSCGYINWCTQCGKTTLCDDCTEEDWISFTPGSSVSKATSEPSSMKGVNLPIVCQSNDCLTKFCRECWHRSRCGGCGMVFCDRCMYRGYVGEWRQCKECDLTFCDSCMELKSDVCIKCEPLGE